MGVIKYDYDFVKEYVEGFGYKLLSGYTGIHDKIILECPNGHIYNTSFNSFYSNKCRCGKCKNLETANKRKYSIDYIQEYLNSFGYKLLTKNYINNKQKMKIECPEGHIFYMCFSKFKNAKQRCPICKMSSGEQEVYRILSKYFDDIEIQYKFSDCKDEKRLPFDFYLPQCNCCIEFDGVQHFEYQPHFGTYSKFLKQQKRDMIKTEYCKNNNIKLIRIPYYEFDNIEKILNKELKVK